MELTDPGLLILLGAVALVIFALVVAGRPRWGNGAVQAGTRALQVVLLNLVVVALCGAALNNQYLFYSSWGDLLGSRSASVQAQHGATVASAVAAKVAGPGFTGISSPGSLPPLPQPGSRLQNYTVTDSRSGSGGQVLVYLPVGYDPRSAHQYPVIIGLHGFPSAPQGFVRLNFLSSLDALTAQHKMALSGQDCKFVGGQVQAVGSPR